MRHGGTRAGALVGHERGTAGLATTATGGASTICVTSSLLNCFAEVPRPVVQQLLGHADLATTQRYADMVASDRMAAIALFDQ